MRLPIEDRLLAASASRRLTEEVDNVICILTLISSIRSVRPTTIPPPNGIAIDELLEAIAFIGAQIPIAAGGTGSHYPSSDPVGRTAMAAAQVMNALIAANGKKRP